MSDLYELTVTVDLLDGIGQGELAELQWHLGLGDQPEQLSLVTAFPAVVLDGSGIPVIEDEPYPLLAGRGAASRVGGVLGSALASRASLARAGWSLTSRQEIHPDEFDKVGELLVQLAQRAHPTHLRGDGAARIGWLRFHEAEVPEVLWVEDGQVGWPA